MKIRFTFLLAFCLAATTFLNAQTVELVATGMGGNFGMCVGGNAVYKRSAFDIVKADLSQPLPAPAVNLLTGITDLRNVLVVGDYLYLTGTSNLPGLSCSVGRVNLTVMNPTIEAVATNLTGSYGTIGMLRKGDNLYIGAVGSNLNGLYKVNLAAPFPQSATAVITGVLCYQIALHENNMYFNDPTYSTISTFDITQPTPAVTTVLSGGQMVGLTFHRNHLYFCDLTSPAGIKRIDVTQPVPVIETILSDQQNVNALAIDGNQLYFGKPDGTVARAFLAPADDCADADNINYLFGAAYNMPQTSGLYDNTGYNSTGDPATGFECHVGDPGLKHTIWYSFTGDGNNYRIRSVQCTATNPNNDTQIAIYSGSDCGALAPVACNDDQDASNNIYNFNVELATVPGQAYRMLVDGYGEAQGQFCLEVTNLSQTAISFPSLGNVCSNEGVNFPGSATPTGGVYSGPGVTDSGNGSDFNFNPNTAGGPGTYTVTYTLPNGLSATATITVTAAPVITVFGFQTSVNTAPNPIPDPIAGPAGGVYSGIGVLPGNIFDAGLAGIGVHLLTYTFTDANGCTGTGTGTIKVNPAPHDVCNDANNINNLFGGPANMPQTSGLYDNTNYNSTGDPTTGFECHVGDPGLKHTIWYSFTGDGNNYRIRSVQCTATNPNNDTQIAIYSGSDCGALAPVACNDDQDASNNSYNFNVELATVPGQAYRMLVDGYGEAQGQFCLEVTNLSQTAISFPSLGNVCSNEGVNFPGSATPTGGVYSGPGVTDSGNGSDFNFNPNTAGGPGNYTVTYTLPNGSTATATITVTAAPVIGVFGFITDVITPPFPLPDPGAGPVGGVYSGPGVLAGNIFDAALAGVGVHLITYAFTDANGCTGTGTGTITVNQASVLPADNCANANDINSLFSGPHNAPQTSSLYNNTGYTSTGDPAAGYECHFNSEPLQNTVWYTFTGNGKTYRIQAVQCNATNYNNDTQVAIYSGDCGTLVPVACGEDLDGPNGILYFSVELVTIPGLTYHMLVDGYGGLQGEFCLEVTNLTTSAITEIGRTGLRLFPNPTTGVVQLVNVSAHHVQVFDSKGRIVMQVDHPGNQIDISAVPAGMYFLKIAEGDRVSTARVVKE